MFGELLMSGEGRLGSGARGSKAHESGGRKSGEEEDK